MTCERCGKILELDEKFCPACGKPVAVPAETTDTPAAPEEAENSAPAAVHGMSCTQNDRAGASTAAFYKAPAQQPPTAAQYKAPVVQPAGQEKEYFGRGALALCLIVIGLLAGAAGTFAYLYFSLIGMI
ncbi:MAG: hypothetical protein K5876_01755 [Ruminiclostridium sp.]|nr:hypothetical protein [Ruminiclostridium sp.]